MKTGFKDPIEPRQKKEGETPWNWKCPAYDERSSCYMQAGTDYGVGFNQPVGHKGSATMKGGVPSGARTTMPSYPLKREMI